MPLSEHTHLRLPDAVQPSSYSSISPKALVDQLNIPTFATTRQQRKGLFLGALSAIAFAAMTLLVRTLSDAKMSSLQIMFWRCIVQTPVAIAACLTMGVQPFRVKHGWRRFRWVLMRALCGSIGHLLYYVAIAHLPMGVATVLFFTNPIFTALLAYFILDEPFTKRQRGLTLGSLAGIALVVMPLNPLMLLTGLGGFLSLWSLSALLGALSVALAYVSIRLAGRVVHPMVHVVYFGIVGAIGAVAAAWAKGELTGWQWWALPQGSSASVIAISIVGVGVMAFLAQYLMNWGLQLASAGPVVMMRNADVAIGFVLDAVLYHSVPSMGSVLGAVIVTACVIMMGIKS
ncbi:hypothetical protein GGI07_005340 [Coemansia sp. Benny D115]|nr:hypothetical protein GGI07_005340 [Coemansia sp. Benny D115]